MTPLFRFKDIAPPRQFAGGANLHMQFENSIPHSHQWNANEYKQFLSQFYAFNPIRWDKLTHNHIFDITPLWKGWINSLILMHLRWTRLIKSEATSTRFNLFSPIFIRLFGGLVNLLFVSLVRAWLNWLSSKNRGGPCVLVLSNLDHPFLVSPLGGVLAGSVLNQWSSSLSVLNAM